LPIKIAVGRRPTVSIISPTEGFRFPSQQTNLSIKVKAIQPEGKIAKVDFYANDELIGSAHDIATEQFFLTWRNVREGVYSLTAIATDGMGVTGKSQPVQITIEKWRGNQPQ
jgi:hypothetical protein